MLVQRQFGYWESDSTELVIMTDTIIYNGEKFSYGADCSEWTGPEIMIECRYAVNFRKKFWFVYNGETLYNAYTEERFNRKD